MSEQQPFVPGDVERFVVDGADIDWTAADGIAVACRYRLLDAVGAVLVACEERYVFPHPASVTETRQRAFEALVQRLAVVAGLSYYKLAAPGTVELARGEWSADDVGAFRVILARGLGEYCFVNGLDPELSPTFEYRSPARTAAPANDVGLDRGPLVPVGGGKDSCVSIEALRNAGFAPTLVTVRRPPLIADVIAHADLPDLAVERTLDPQLRWLNANGARNGHVPATAIVSLAVAAAAVLHGHDAVVMSNERSASEGNVSYRGAEINHQWSKSDEAESLLSALINRVAPDLAYFSLLRPLSELSIARRFADTCERYLSSFSSCNGNFKVDPADRGSRWCKQCPKCQFVYLALATAMPRAALEAVFGGEVFAASDPQGFRALLGLTEWKPFECVGESGECRVALDMVHGHPDWRDHPTLQALLAELGARGWAASDEARRAVLAVEPSPAIPPRYRAAIGAAVGVP